MSTLSLEERTAGNDQESGLWEQTDPRTSRVCYVDKANINGQGGRRAKGPPCGLEQGHGLALKHLSRELGHNQQVCSSHGATSQPQVCILCVHQASTHRHCSAPLRQLGRLSEFLSD